jgi:Predicted CoA-binding protein
MVNEMLEMKTWAVVGASENKEKFGWKIYKKLKDKGYSVYPVSPNYETIDGDKCYKNLTELPEKPDVIDMVINPKYGINTVKEASELGIKNIWLQPGTYNDELLALIDEEGLNKVKACVLVELG